MFRVTDVGELMTAVEAIPLFPLPGTVFVPHTMLSLHVFEPRYRDLVDDVMKGSKFLAVPRLRPGWEQNYELAPDIFSVAGFGKIVRYEPFPDGRANIVIVGLGRIKVRQELGADALYRVAEGVLLGDDLPNQGMSSIDAQVGRLRMMFAQILGGRPDLADRLTPLLRNEVTSIPLIDGMAHVLLPDVDARQRYIEIDGVEERIEMVETLLAGAIVNAVSHA